MNLRGRVLVLHADVRFRRAVLGALRRHRLACDGLGDAREAGRLLRRGGHDVLVVDVGSAANRQVVPRLRRSSGPLVVAVTRRPSVEGALAAFRARAVDYLTDPIRLTVLVGSIRRALEKSHAVRGVQRAERVIALWAEWMHLLDAVLAAPGPAALPDRLLVAIARERLWSDPGGSAWPRDAALLSAREREVLLALGSGLRVRQIAGALGVSIHTARGHLKAVMRKLNVHSQVALLERLHAAPRDPFDASASEQEESDERW